MKEVTVTEVDQKNACVGVFVFLCVSLFFIFREVWWGGSLGRLFSLSHVTNRTGVKLDKKYNFIVPYFLPSSLSFLSLLYFLRNKLLHSKSLTNKDRDRKNYKGVIPVRWSPKP